MPTRSSGRRAILMVALFGVAIAVVGIVFVERAPRRAASEAPGPDADMGAVAPAAPSRQLISVPRSPEAIPVPDASADGHPTDAAGTAVPYRSWRSVLIEEQNKNIRDVDEYLFGIFRVSEEAREGVRQVNEAYSRRIEALARSPQGIPNKTRLERDRKLELFKVLGPQTGAFIESEYREMRRLRQLYHRQFTHKPPAR